MRFFRRINEPKAPETREVGRCRVRWTLTDGRVKHLDIDGWWLKGNSVFRDFIHTAEGEARYHIAEAFRRGYLDTDEGFIPVRLIEKAEIVEEAPFAPTATSSL